MRSAHIRRAAGLLAAALTLGTAGGALAAPHAKVMATFKGRTSQGRAITIQYLEIGHQGVIRFSTHVVGSCPVQGLGTARETEAVGSHAHGAWPVPAKWSWEDKGAGYDLSIRAKARHRRSLRGQVYASWQTSIDNMPTCTTPVISFTAKRR